MIVRRTNVSSELDFSVDSMIMSPGQSKRLPCGVPEDKRRGKSVREQEIVKCVYPGEYQKILPLYRPRAVLGRITVWSEHLFGDPHWVGKGNQVKGDLHRGRVDRGDRRLDRDDRRVAWGGRGWMWSSCRTGIAVVYERRWCLLRRCLLRRRRCLGGKMGQ